jgi:hypothetical protein
VAEAEHHPRLDEANGFFRRLLFVWKGVLPRHVYLPKKPLLSQNCLAQNLEPSHGVLAQVKAYHPPARGLQGPAIAKGLGSLEDAEGDG